MDCPLAHILCTKPLCQHGAGPRGSHWRSPTTQTTGAGRTPWQKRSQVARFMGPTWGPPGDDRTQVGPMLAPWTVLLGVSIPVQVSLAVYRHAQFNILSPVAISAIFCPAESPGGAGGMSYTAARGILLQLTRLSPAVPRAFCLIRVASRCHM